MWPSNIADNCVACPVSSACCFLNISNAGISFNEKCVPSWNLRRSLIRDEWSYSLLLRNRNQNFRLLMMLLMMLLIDKNNFFTQIAFKFVISLNFPHFLLVDSTLT